MKLDPQTIIPVNIVLFLFMCWLCWVGHFHLPGQLDNVKPTELVLTRYQNVCARLTVSLAGWSLVVMVIINAVLIRVAGIEKKNLSSTESEHGG